MSRTKQHQHLSIPKGILNLELFQPERLKELDDDALDVALHSVYQFLRPDSVQSVLEVALERHGCLEFLLSCKLRDFLMCDSIIPQPLRLTALSQDKFNSVSKWISDMFPQDLDGHSATSLCARLISKLSVSLLFLQYPSEDERPQHLNSFHEYVTLSTTALQALASVTQSSVSEIEESSSKVSQKARKHAKRTRQAKSIDVTPFRALHLEVPALRHEAMEMALEILMKQKEILSVMTIVPYLPTLQLTVSHSRTLTCSALNHSQTCLRKTIFHLPPSKKSLKTQAHIRPAR